MASMLKVFVSPFLFLFIHLGCFTISSSSRPNPNPVEQPPTKRRRKLSPASFVSYLNHVFSFGKPDRALNDHIDHHIHQLIHEPLPPTPDRTPTPPSSTTLPPSIRRTDMYPCTACGEVLTKPQLLELHQATKHSLSDLTDGDSGKKVLQLIFFSGWKGKSSSTIHRILKIHNSANTLSCFEEYRQIVRSRRGSDARCIADGNEQLRFYCTTILCTLTGTVSSHMGACGSPYCSTCAVVRHGFAGKQVELDGIATYKTSWEAHVSLPDDLEKEFAFLNVRRAVLVCRVVAGRVARGREEEEKKGTVFNSVVPVDGDELLVFNPRAVLPCFVIVYSV